MHAFRILVVVLLAAGILSETPAAQGLAVGLFERYLEPLRQQSGIPGLSAAIVHGRRIVWDDGFGFADVERSINARPDTPYPIADLTQTLGATLVLQRVERGDFDLRDRIQRWTTLIPESAATVGQVLTHTSSGTYEYNPGRFAALTTVLEYYGRVPFRRILADEILDRLGMIDSVPGHDIEQAAVEQRAFFEGDDLARYQSSLGRLAVPYRVDSRGRTVRSEYPNRTINAATGLISTVRDLARFDAALDDAVLVRAPSLALMWTPAAAAATANGGRAPMGHGWFVQEYKGERLVWHFGVADRAFSSLILKVPGRDLTLILLANSDGLSAPFALSQGDVTKSLFALTFLRIFVG